MGTKLDKKRYNDKIKIYYQDDSYFSLAEEIISFIWLKNNKSIISYELIKDDKGKVYKIEYNNQTYYLKSYSYRNFKKNIKNIFRSSEAVRYFKLAIKLISADITVTEPVLGLTLRRNLFMIDSIFVMKEVPGVDLHTYLFKSDKCNKIIRRKTINKFALIWGKLINNNFLHQDPCLRNFMINLKQGEVQIKLIDIDNIYLLPIFPKKMLMKNLAKLRSRQLTDFKKTNTEPLNQVEVNTFLKEFKKNCKKEIEISSLFNAISIETVKRLIKYDRKNIILEDKTLCKLYKEKWERGTY